MHKSNSTPQQSVSKCSIAYDENVVNGEFVWEIKGLSWVPHTLEHEHRRCTHSEDFSIVPKDSDSRYVLAYSPRAKGIYASDVDAFEVHDDTFNGTLALIRTYTAYGASLDVSFFVQGPTGFVQWGERSRKAWVGGDGRNIHLGPDLDSENKGVMGLSFEELLQSEWVRDDTIVFKVCIQEHALPTVDPHRLYENEVVTATPLDGIEIPPSTLSADLLSMLTDGVHSDVRVEVVGCADNAAAATTTFAAHACILSQRSDVFRAALSHEMREAETKTIRVTDLAPLAVKALLVYLYSGSLDEVDKVLNEEEEATAPTAEGPATGGSGAAAAAQPSSSSSPAVVPAASAVPPSRAEQRVAKLEAVLAAAHKYQVARLLAWCEQQLCTTLELPSACALLSLSLLYDATQLTHTCLAFMKAHHAEVVKLDAFGTLPHEAMLRFNMHLAGVDPAEAGGGRKRKRAAE